MEGAARRLPVIDGLRAFAVIAVVLFHGFPGIVRGGYIGVDVFFVISGFVIALRYLQPMVAGEIGFATFFARRIRRLVPAYFAMLVAATLVAAWVMAPRDLVNYGASLLGQALYAQNIVFWVQGDYFDAALRKPLLHTWSLGVEEQFYLCFPLLVIALRRWPRLAALACILVGLLALGLGAYVERISPKTSFYWLPFRTWEFLAGIAVAQLYTRGVAARMPAAVASLGGVLAIVGLFAAALLFDDDTASILTQGLLAVTATAILCLVQERMADAVRACFTNAGAQHFGRISYSWYLWHWPPLAFAFLLFGRPAAGWEAVALTLLGYGLGLLSWRLFERGASHAAWLARRRRAALLLLGFLLFSGLAGSALVASQGLLQRYPADVQPLLRAQMDRPDGRCTFASRLREWRGQTCLVNDVTGPGGILFIGDSHVEMQKAALARLGRQAGVPVYITKQNCRIVDYGVDRNCRWPVWKSVARDIRRHRIAHVVAIALWPEPFDRAAFDAAVVRLLTTGAQVTLERPTPHADRLAPDHYLSQPGAWGERSRYPTAEHVRRTQDVTAAMADWAARDPRIRVIDPTPLLCPDARCRFALAGRPLYSDTHHLTAAGVAAIEPIYATLFAAARQAREARR